MERDLDPSGEKRGILYNLPCTRGCIPECMGIIEKASILLFQLKCSSSVADISVTDCNQC